MLLKNCSVDGKTHTKHLLVFTDECRLITSQYRIGANDVVQKATAKHTPNIIIVYVSHRLLGKTHCVYESKATKNKVKKSARTTQKK